jgi:hypothetical protein
LRERLFAGNIPAASQPDTRILWNWLGPVTVCAFTMLVILGNHSRSQTRMGVPDTNLFFASITMTSVPPAKSEASSVFGLSKQDLNLEQNVWREAILESTNHEQSPSSKRSLPVRETNSLTL